MESAILPKTLLLPSHTSPRPRSPPLPLLLPHYPCSPARARCLGPSLPSLPPPPLSLSICFPGFVLVPSRFASLSSSFSCSSSATAAGSGGGGGELAGGAGGGGGGDRGPNGGKAEAGPLAGSSEEVSALGSDVIVLHVGGMTCGGCAASVKRILESQPDVSSAIVYLETEIAVIWVVPEVKVTEDWQHQLGEKLANHLTTCGFKSHLQVDNPTLQS